MTRKSNRKPRIRMSDHERIIELEEKCDYLYSLNMNLGNEFVTLATQVDEIFQMNKQVTDQMTEFMSRFIKVTPEMLQTKN